MFDFSDFHRCKDTGDYTKCPDGEDFDLSIGGEEDLAKCRMEDWTLVPQ